MIKFLDLQKQYSNIQEEIDEVVSRVIKSASFVGGPYLASFEKNFANYCEVEHCIGVGNGTDALEIALWSLDLPKNSEVLVPANSFIATSEAVTRNNLKVRFVDCDENYQMCPVSLKRNISKDSSAIIVVHLYGHPANMDLILAIAEEENLKVIEDCAQAHGARYKEKRVGTFGDIATFSFYPGKNLGAYGDGGAIITANQDLEVRCRQYANHGRSSKFGHEIEGINSRLDGLQAAILDVKLNHLDLWSNRRREIAKKYLSSINNPLIKLPKLSDDVDAVWHLFVVATNQQSELKTYLESCCIQVGIHYPVALPSLKAYEYLDEDYRYYKACQEDKTLLSIPMGEHLTNEEVDIIIEKVNEFGL